MPVGFRKEGKRTRNEWMLSRGDHKDKGQLRILLPGERKRRPVGDMFDVCGAALPAQSCPVLGPRWCNCEQAEQDVGKQGAVSLSSSVSQLANEGLCNCNTRRS